MSTLALGEHFTEQSSYGAGQLCLREAEMCRAAGGAQLLVLCWPGSCLVSGGCVADLLCQVLTELLQPLAQDAGAPRLMLPAGGWAVTHRTDLIESIS